MEKHSPRDRSTVRGMELKVSHCFIPVHDRDEALAFYRDVLGLEVRNDVKREGMLRTVIFATDDCDATFEHVCRAGAEVLQEPMNHGYGIRDCAFRDPSGNIVRFSQKR